MRLGTGLGLTDFGTKGAVSDRADGTTRAIALLGSETNGLAMAFTDMTMVVRDTGTPANSFIGAPSSKLTYSSPSTKWILGQNGLYSSGTTLRTEYNSSGVALGLRVEESRTNLCTRSNDLTVTWTNTNTTDAAGTGMDGGGSTGSVITASSGAAAHYMTFSLTWTATVHTLSAIVAYTNHQYVQFTTWDGTATRHMNFDIQNGTVGTGSGFTGTITQVGSGVYRIVAVMTSAPAAAAGNVTFAFSNASGAAANVSFSAAGTETINVRHVQIEAASSESSPIQTAGSTVTRAADNITLATSLFPYGATARTLYVRYRPNATGVSMDVAGLKTAASLNEVFGVYQSGGTTPAINRTGGTVNAQFNGAVLSENKVALAGAANDYNCGHNGSTGADDTAGALAAPDTLVLGTMNYSGGTFVKHIKEIMVLPRRMTNAQLQALTA